MTKMSLSQHNRRLYIVTISYSCQRHCSNVNPITNTSFCSTGSWQLCSLQARLGFANVCIRKLTGIGQTAVLQVACVPNQQRCWQYLLKELRYQYLSVKVSEVLTRTSLPTNSV